MKIKFCGATTGVTGSCHLLSTDKHRVLLDCGQFQGGKSQDKLNYEEFPFDPKDVECMILSHAHIDHCGRIPLLVKRGFTGKIYCTKATADLLPIMLKDSGYIHEKEAEWANKKGQRKGQAPVKPLYTVADAEESLKYITPVIYGQRIEINDEMMVNFDDAGHILGSAMIEIWIKENGDEKKIVFSGDIGVMNRPILNDPTMIKKADYVIMETTYGDRVHPENSLSIGALLQVVLRTVKRHGTVVIPSFAVGRTQELIFEFNKLYDDDPEIYAKLKNVKVYIDSPMANSATQVFKDNVSVFDKEAQEYINNNDHPLEFENLCFTQSTADSQSLNENTEPKIIISASGMCEAGRIRHHLKHNLWNPKSSIVFVGYQAEGTLGRKLVEGAKTVNLFGEEIQVKAEIVNLEGFSAHADKNGLEQWLAAFETDPEVFLVHGESDAKHAFARQIADDLGAHSIVLEENTEFDLKEKKKVKDSGAALNAGAGDSAFDAELSAEDLQALRNKISTISGEIEDVLGGAKMATGKKISPEQLIRINNVVQALSANTIELREATLEEKVVERGEQ